MKLKNFFNPKGIAVIGASTNPKKIGYQVVDNIVNSNYRGEIFPINIKSKTFRSIEDLTINYWSQLLVLIVIPAPLVAQELKKCAQLGIKNFVIISAGFKENGVMGEKLEQDLFNIIKKYDLQVLGPNCLGFINNLAPFNASFSKSTTKAGSLALISQSGAIGSTALDWLLSENLNLAYFISLGNKSFLNENDFLRYLAKDNQVKAVILYLEEISNGLELIKLSAEIFKNKPIFILMAGLNQASQEIVKSHTGALAGNKDIIKLGLRAGGIVQVENLQDVFSLFPVLSNWPQIENKLKNISLRSLNLLTNAGGLAALSADFSSKFDINIKTSLDILGDAKPEDYKIALLKMLKSDSKTVILVLLSPQADTQAEQVAKNLIEVSKLSKYRNSLIVASLMGGNDLQITNKYLMNNNFLAYNFPETALHVLDYLFTYEELRRASYNNLKKLKTQIKPLIQSNQENNLLDYLKSFSLLKKYKIPVLETNKFKNIKFIKKSDFPLVMKIVGPDFIHKTDKQAIFLNINNKTELKALASNCRKNHKLDYKNKDNYLVLQAQKESELELILGLKRDSNFGHILLLGLGGIYSEVFRQSKLSLANLNKQEALRFIKSLDFYPLLSGVRGTKAYNLNKLADILVNLSKLAQDNPQIKELDINPLFVQTNNYLAVDIRIFID